MAYRCLPAILLTILTLPPLPAQDTTAQKQYPQRHYQTMRIVDEPPRIDGSPTEASWDLVEWSGDYVQYTPNPDQPPTQPATSSPATPATISSSRLPTAGCGDQD